MAEIYHTSDTENLSILTLKTIIQIHASNSFYCPTLAQRYQYLKKLLKQLSSFTNGISIPNNKMGTAQKHKARHGDVTLSSISLSKSRISQNNQFKIHKAGQSQ